MRILFVSHDASRTGAPIVLLHLLKWLKKNNAYKFSVYLARGGDLEGAFREIATTYTAYSKPSASGVRGISNKALKKLKLIKEPDDSVTLLSPELLSQQFDLVYLNTVDTLYLAPLLKQMFQCSIIAHIHENEYSIKAFYPLSFHEENISSIDHFIAVSVSTKDNLITNFHISPQKVSLIYEFIDNSEIQAPTVGVDEIKQTLGLKNEFIVGASGLTSWRKGVDLFVQLALELNRL